MQDERSGKKFRRTLLVGGVRENRFLQSVYTLTVDGKLQGISATHEDDLLDAFDGTNGRSVVNHIKQHLVMSKESECNFSYRGREVRQTVEHRDYSVHVACEATTRKISEIRFEGSHEDSAQALHSFKTGAARKRDWIAVLGGSDCGVRVSEVMSR